MLCAAGRTMIGGGAFANGWLASLTTAKPALTSEGSPRNGWQAQGTNWENLNLGLYVSCV